MWARLLADAGSDLTMQPARIAGLCVQMLGVTGAGISMVTTAGNRGVVCATDDVSAQIEDLQLTLGAGPCVDAVGGRGPVCIADLDEPGDLVVERWPVFMKSAAAAGVRAVFAFPLRIGAIAVGALDLYRDHAGDLTPDQLAGALLAADAAAVALLHLETGLEATFADDDSIRSTYHLQVHQATGMVQVQLDTTTERAFLMLRARAFADGRSLTETADDVVARRLRFSSEDL